MYSKAKHIVAFGLFGLYLSITGPSIVWGDGSFIVASSYLLGIPHPTGHPLFSFLGKIASFIPLGNIAFRLDLMSVLLCLVSIYLVFALCDCVLRLSFKNIKDNSPAYFIIPLVMALSFGLSLMVLEQASSVETYMLNICLSMFLVYTAVLSESILDAGGDTKKIKVLFLAACFASGIAYGNHTLLIFALAIPLFAYFLARLVHMRSPSTLLLGLIFLVLGLSIYMYLPIRAAKGPLLNHGDPSNIANFIWVTTAKQFTETNFSVGRFLENIDLKNIWFATWTSCDTLLRNLGYYWFAFALAGAVFLRRRKLLLLFFAAALLVNIGITYPPTFAAGVSMEERGVAGYFFLSLAILFILSAVSLKKLFDLIERKGGRLKGILTTSLASSLILAPMVNCYVGWKFDRSNDYTTLFYGRSLLGYMDFGGALLSLSDAGMFIPYYMQGCEDYRTDITLLHSPMFFNGQGLNLLKKQHPSVFEGSVAGGSKFFSDEQYRNFIDHLALKQSLYLEIGRRLVVKNDRLYPNMLTLGYGKMGQGSISASLARARRSVELLRSEYYAGNDEGMLNFAIPFYNIGNFFQKRGLHDAAAEQYLMTLELDPSMKGAAVNLLVSLGMSGLVGKALHFGHDFIRRFDEPLIHYNYANLLYTVGRGKEAVEVIKDASRFGEQAMFKDLLAKIEKGMKTR